MTAAARAVTDDISDEEFAGAIPEDGWFDEQRTDVALAAEDLADVMVVVRAIRFVVRRCRSEAARRVTRNLLVSALEAS